MVISLLANQEHNNMYNYYYHFVSFVVDCILHSVIFRSNRGKTLQDCSFG